MTFYWTDRFLTAQKPVRQLLLFCLCATAAVSMGCSKPASGSKDLSSQAPDPICPFSTSLTFDTPVNISGKAVYEYRVDGNGNASDDGLNFSIKNPQPPANPVPPVVSLEVDGMAFTVNNPETRVAAALELKNQINNSGSGLVAYGQADFLTVTKPQSRTPPHTTSAIVGLNSSASNPSPRPIRLVEIIIRDSHSTIVQCSQTDNNGEFSFELPKDTGLYSVEVTTRALNSRNSVYVLNSPDTNRHYSLTASINSNASVTDLFLRAQVHDPMLLGGAFNMIDQILNAQDFLRAATQDCDKPNSSNYFSGCIPFIVAPLIKLYWRAGFSPSTYVGVSGSISYYLNGKNELYIQGGQGGNVVSSDMDHFDNSVVLHEYAHFLQDAYGRASSPGGNHSGDGIIDPRIAWSEGWANFFQAVVSGIPIYRDTYGTPDCVSFCRGAYFNESIDRNSDPVHDIPTSGKIGEGNYREFSVSRMFWQAVNPVTGISSFAEVWRSFTAPGIGMKDIDDPYQTVGRFHSIQASSSGAISWQAVRDNEEQTIETVHYGAPFSFVSIGGCGSSPMVMAPHRESFDTGDFQFSNQYYSNAFYTLRHTGGVLKIELFYSKNPLDPVDLDLFLYGKNYVYGRSRDIVLQSSILGDGCPHSGVFDPLDPFQAKNGCPIRPAGISAPYGYETSTLDLLPGTYMINVKADTSIRAGNTTNYAIIINGKEVCPAN